MKVVICIPAYDEARTVANVIAGVRAATAGNSVVEIIVVDDGSSDATVELARRAGAVVVSLSSHQGLGAAFQSGVHEALVRGADVLVTIDADEQFTATDIPLLLRPILEGRADVVTASRFADPARTPTMPGLKRWGNRVVARVVSRLSGQCIADVSCGFRAYSAEVLLHLNLFGRHTYTHESLLNLLFRGFRVVEVPVTVRGERAQGVSRVANNLWRYGYAMLTIIFRTVLDYKPLRVFGWLGVSVFGIGLILDAFVAVHYIQTGMVTPYKTIGFIGGFFNMFGFGILTLGLVADMLNRVRQTAERSLYHAKRATYGRGQTQTPTFRGIDWSA
ncbi:MAG: glycosyltransferase family 2 protein [Patescibacteria group bacterium]